jgi:hypothetical protein
MRKQNHQQNQKSTKKQQLLLKTRKGNITTTGKQHTPKAEEGYCNETTHSGPLTHSQSHQAQNMVEHTEVKQRRAWTKEEIREVLWYYTYCRQHFAKKITRKCIKCGDNKHRMQNVHGRQETNEPETLHYETQQDNGDASRGDKERTARKSEKSPRRKRGRKARTFRHYKG